MKTQTAAGQTLSQRRAAFALNGVRSVAGTEFAGDFRSYAASLPPMIQMNGFGQALAFCRSKNDQAYQALYQLVSDWLTREGQPYERHQDALEGITLEGMSAYRLAQTEALALLEWVKRFAAAYIERNAKTGNSGPDVSNSSQPAAGPESPEP